MLWFISVKRSVDSELSDQYPVVLSVINHSILVFQFSEYHNILTEQEKKKKIIVILECKPDSHAKHQV